MMSKANAEKKVAEWFVGVTAAAFLVAENQSPANAACGGS